MYSIRLKKLILCLAILPFVFASSSLIARGMERPQFHGPGMEYHHPYTPHPYSTPYSGAQHPYEKGLEQGAQYGEGASGGAVVVPEQPVYTTPPSTYYPNPTYPYSQPPAGQ